LIGVLFCLSILTIATVEYGAIISAEVQKRQSIQDILQEIKHAPPKGLEATYERLRDFG
jgi:hypothetical protein